MIVQTNNNYTATNTGVTKISMSEKDIDKIMQITTAKIYRNQYSWITEVLQNSNDCHKECKVTDKVKIYFSADSQGTYIAIQDFGCGISPYIMENYLSKLGASTKDTSNEYSGGFGIGFASIGAYEQSDKAYLTTICEGVKYEYLYSASALSFYLLNQEDVFEPNGTTVKVYYKGYWEKDNLKAAIHKQCVYFDCVDFETFNNPLYKHETFWYSKDFKGDSNIHISYNGYYYEFPYKLLSVSEIKIPVAIPFEVSELKPSASREDIQWNTESLKLAKEKLDKLLEHLKENISLETDNLADYYKLKNDRVVNYKDIFDFDYKNLGYSREDVIFTPLKELNLKNVLPNLGYYYLVCNNIKQYINYDNNFLKINRLFYADIPFSKFKYLKSYLDGKYIIENREFNLREKYGKHGWIEFLELKKYPKSEWRNRINTYLNWFKTQFKVQLISEVVHTQDFKNYVSGKKEELKKSVKAKKVKITYVGEYNYKLSKVVFKKEYNYKAKAKDLIVTKDTDNTLLTFLFSLMYYSDYNLVLDKVEDYKWYFETEDFKNRYRSFKIKEWRYTDYEWKIEQLDDTLLDSFKSIREFKSSYYVKDILSDKDILHLFENNLPKTFDKDLIPIELQESKSKIDKFIQNNQWIKELPNYDKGLLLNLNNYIQNLKDIIKEQNDVIKNQKDLINNLK